MAVRVRRTEKFSELHKLFPVVGEHHLLEEEIKLIPAGARVSHSFTKDNYSLLTEFFIFKKKMFVQINTVVHPYRLLVISIYKRATYV